MTTVGSATTAHVATTTRPRRRPPVGVRVFIGLLGIGALLFTGALMLSDKAPGALKTLFGDRARRLWERIDQSERANVLTDRGTPEPDTVVHIAVWATVLVLVGLAVWTWRGLLATTIGVFVISLIVELAQGRYSQSRNVTMSDAVANGWGVIIGATAVALIFATWSAAAAVLRPASRSTTPGLRSSP